MFNVKSLLVRIVGVQLTRVNAFRIQRPLNRFIRKHKRKVTYFEIGESKIQQIEVKKFIPNSHKYVCRGRLYFSQFKTESDRMKC